jgi:hypothetical protein
MEHASEVLHHEHFNGVEANDGGILHYILN